jgi:hypothetical protein
VCPPAKKTRLAEKVFHLHVKDHVASYFVVGWGDILFTIHDLECNMDVIHIFPDCILPESVAIFFIPFQSFTPSLGNLNPKLMSAVVVPLGHRGNDYVALLQDMGYSPSKSRLIMQFLGGKIFSHFNGATFLQVGQPFPGFFPILPFNTQMSTLHCLPYLCVASNLDTHVSALHCMTISFVSNNVL